MENSNKKIWHWLALIGAILLVLGTIFYLFIPNLFSKGMMHGGDETAHMFLPKHAIDYYKAHHHFPVINPYWYNGIEPFHHIPWLDYIPVGIIYLITNDIYVTDRIFTLLLLALAGLSMFFLLYKKGNIRSAIMGAIIYPFIPIVFHATRISITRGTPMVLMPLAFYFTDEILEKDFNFRNFIILILILAAMIFAHPITGVTLLIFLITYILIRTLIDRKVPFKKFLIWLSAFAAASGLIAFYAMPFLAEPITYSYPGDIGIRKIGEVASLMAIYIGGIPLIGLGIFSFFRQHNRKKWALLITAIFSFLSVTLFATPFFNLLPWAHPYPILTLTVITILYWATTAFEFPKLSSKIRLTIAFLAIPLIIIPSLINMNNLGKINNTKDATKSFTRVWTLEFEKAYPQLSEALKNIPNPGRVFSIKNVSREEWVVTAVADKYYSEGHYFSTTRLSKEIAWVNDAIDNGYLDYVVNKMNLFNDRYFIFTSDLEMFFENNPPQDSSFSDRLLKDGYKPIFAEPKQPIRALYYKDAPSSYLIPLEYETLIVGKHAFNYAAFQPNSYIGGSIYIDDYDLEFLKSFDSIVLYGFGYHDKAKAEELVSDFTKQGGRVMIDMLNVENSKLEAEDIFLGIQSTLEKTVTPLNLEFAQNFQNNPLPQKLELPSEKDFTSSVLRKAELIPLKEWRFTEYLNLDGSLVRWQNRPDGDGSNLYSLAGYKNIDGNKIWFVGGNLIYHAYLTHNEQEQEFLKTLSTKDSATSLNAKPYAPNPNLIITSQNLDPEAGKMEFSYTASENSPLLVSYTISPHWKAYLNGKPTKIYNIDSMMALNLPSGENKVVLKYETLPNHYFAKGITILTIILLIGIYIWDRKRKKKENVQKP